MIARYCIVLLASVSMVPLPAWGQPQGGVVVRGDAQITDTAQHTRITQTSDKAIINWQQFDVPQGHHVEFQQPSASSLTLNRVVGSEQRASEIAGTLTANGNVVLVNPNGIVFRPSARVDVAGLIATTANISDDNFMAGHLAFDQPSPNTDAGILNQGVLSMKDVGLAALVAPSVVNEGVIVGRLGKTILAGAQTATLDLYGDGLIQLAVQDDTLDTLVRNKGVIIQEGGRIILTAHATRTLVNDVVGTPRVLNDGVLAAPTSDTGQEGSISVTATTPDGKAAGLVAVSGVVEARAERIPTPPSLPRKGGVIQISGQTTIVEDALLDVSGQHGGGQLRLGGEYLGGASQTPLPNLTIANLNTPNSHNTWVGAGVTLRGDALESGDGGQLVTWADGDTHFYGSISARGGEAGGDGGFAEVSGKQQLTFQAQAVDLTAAHPDGAKGTLLLDPDDIVIRNFAPNDASIAANLQLWLDASDPATITLTYSTDGVATTASGTVGTNTITTAADVAANLAVGARIRLGAAGAVTTADTLGSDTYTIAAIAGTTITTVEALTTTYTTQTLRRGLVSQWNDKSGLAHNATQGTAANMPLWIANDSIEFKVSRTLVSTTFPREIFTNGSDFSVFNVGYRTGTDPQAGSVAFPYIILTQNGSGGDNDGVRFSTDSVRKSGHFGANGGNINALMRNYINDAFLASVYVEGALAGQGDYRSDIIYSNSARPLTFLYGNFNNPPTGSFNHKENIVYNSALTTSSRNLLEQYQSAKWDIALTPPGTGGDEVTRATASDGYSVFHNGYLKRLSQSANIALVATNSITIDDLTANGGDGVLLLDAGRNLSLTTTTGNITMANTANTLRTQGGSITLNAGGNLILGHLDTGDAHAVTLTGDTISTEHINASSLAVTASQQAMINSSGQTLTLGASSSLSASGSGDAVTLVANRFINDSGSTTHISTPSGRYRLYTSDPAIDALNGMVRPNKRYNVAFGDATDISGNAHFYSIAPILNITAQAQSRPLNTPNAPLTFSVTGFIDGDTSASTLSGSLATTATTTSRAGEYLITLGSVSALFGYAIDYTPATLTVESTFSDILNQRNFERALRCRTVAEPIRTAPPLSTSTLDPEQYWQQFLSFLTTPTAFTYIEQCS